MSQVNITLNTNTVDVNTTNNQIVVTNPDNPTTVNVVQPVTTVVEVITAGPQGPPGPIGSGSGGGSLTGGTNGYIPLWSGSNALTSSIARQTSGSLQISGSTVITGSLAQGLNTQALGLYSHAEGYGSIAIGERSHAEGGSTTATGTYSHAEGANTQANGFASHAEGGSTIAEANYSHAEGCLTSTGTQYAFYANDITNGVITISNYGDITPVVGVGNMLLFDDTDYSNIYGKTAFKIASKYFNGYTIITLEDTTVNTSTALVGDLSYITSWVNSGGNQTVRGDYSHAEGNSTYAFGQYSHVEGTGTKTLGQYSHAEGESTQALGIGSHTEGSITKAIGSYSHAEGDNTQAKGDYSHAEGQETIASGSYSHAEGYLTIAQGDRSHAEGRETIALGPYSHAEGRQTTSQGNFSHAEGVNTISSGDYSHAEGSTTIAYGQGSHAEGLNTISSGSYSHASGLWNLPLTASGAFIIGNGKNDNSRSNIFEVYDSQANVNGNLTVSGLIQCYSDITSNNGFFGNLTGTASYATSASYALSSSRAVSSSFAINALTASYLSGYVSPFPYTGSAIITGSLGITGSLNVTQGITGSLFGTSSWAIDAIRAQNVTTASYALTSSYSNNSTSASYALTASYIQNAQSASYVLNAVSSSFATTSSYATTALNGGVTQILAGTNVILSPTNGLGQVTINATGGNSGFNTATGSYGSFYDTGSVLAASATRIYSMSLSNTDISNGVFVSSSNGDTTKIKFTNAGVYNVQFSAQFSNTDNSIQDTVVWVRKNGTDIPDSSGTVGVPAFKAGSNGQVLASWNYYLNLLANDYIQLCWHVEQANVITLETIAAGTSPTHPRTPSLILTAQRVDTFLSNTGSFSGSFTGEFSGSLFGTSSWAINTLTASYVQNAQSASYVLQAVSASFAVSSSYSVTASYAMNAGGTGGTNLGLVQAMTVGLQNIF
jgi:hypothetical protein